MLRQESRCTQRKPASDEGETIKRGRTLYYTEIKRKGETIKCDRTRNTEIKPVSEEGETIKRDSA